MRDRLYAVNIVMTHGVPNYVTQTAIMHQLTGCTGGGDGPITRYVWRCAADGCTAIATVPQIVTG